MRPHFTSAGGSLFVPVLLALVLLGCGGDSATSVLDPQFEPEVVNQVDTFEFQATGVAEVTQTLTYTWMNTGTQANVDQSCSISGGTATILVRDSQGNVVHSRPLTDGGSYQSGSGQSGAWSLTVTLDGVRGTLNFRLEKTT